MIRIQGISLCARRVPTPFIRSNKARRLIWDHFDVVSANVPSLDQARVICLGEDYDREIDGRRVGEMIELLRVHINLKEDERQVILAEVPPPFPEPLAVDKTEELRQGYGIDPSLPVHGWDDATLWEQMSQTPESSVSKEIFNTLPQRSRSLCQSIGKALKVYHQVIVMGGYSHFYYPIFRSDDWAVHLKTTLSTTTLPYLAHWPHAILIPENRKIY